MNLQLNRRASEATQVLLDDPDRYRVHVTRVPGGGTLIDCGIEAAGGIEAGLQLARICLAGLATVSLAESDSAPSGLAVRVATDWPLEACMASQYAGWKLQTPNFFAMASGPMRSVGSKEPLLDRFDLRERPTQAVGVLETRTLPTAEVFGLVARDCELSPADVTLLVAPTASPAGTIQIVARSVETAIHKLETLDVDLRILRSGCGIAPLPAVGSNDLVALGRTNDAILYGGDVTLWVETDDEAIESWGPRVPSSGSRDFGEPFLKLFERNDRDFYKIDPSLFSPAAVRIVNLKSGRTFSYGATRPDLLTSED